MPHGKGSGVYTAKRNALVNDQGLFGLTVVGQGDDFIDAAFVVLPALTGHGILDGVIHDFFN